MKRILLLLFVFISLNAFSQINIKEGSFRKIDGYVMLDKSEHLDDNDNPMALIKVTTENISAEERARFTYKGNIETYFDVQQHEDGQTYLYISAKPATFIEIIHPDYGKTEYTFPFDLCDYCGYEMVVQYVPLVPVVTQESSKPKKTYLIVKSDQTDAHIYIDDELVNTHEAYKAVDVGSTHTYKIECNLYHTESGSVTVNDRTEIEKKLRPAFGYINISTSPEQGAKAFVDGDYVGLTPITTDKIKSGSHTVVVMKDMYKMKEQSYNVVDGQTTNATLNMDADFVTATGDIDINTTPMDATIYIDGKNYGETPNYISDILIGEHELKLTRQGCAELKKTIVVKEGETLTINETLQTGKEITITTDQSGDKIYVDGNYAGISPVTTNLSFGNHEIKAERNGKTVNKNIEVSQAETNGGVSDKCELTFFANQTISVNGVSFTMVAVEGGTFLMGASRDPYLEEFPVHNVTLSDYYIGETEVTQELWETVMKDRPSCSFGNKKPVGNVSWDDCQEFITKLNQLTGKNFRLPTEAEWEYAARGGNRSNDYKYSGSDTIQNVAWYNYNYNTTHDVKTKQANELGIYDMTGNVWEWCQDWYGKYSGSSQTNPTGPSSGNYRVKRGGGNDGGSFKPVMQRGYDTSGSKGCTYGLRLSLSKD